jgi:hypothetical protein
MSNMSARMMIKDIIRSTKYSSKSGITSCSQGLTAALRILDNETEIPVSNFLHLLKIT